MKKTTNNPAPLTLKEFTPDSLVALMDVYLSEWEHRDTLFWTQVFRYFYATLVTIFLPNMAAKIGVDLPNFPAVLFPVTGMGLALLFLIVSKGYSLRLRASGDSYQALIEMLPEEMRRVPLRDLTRSRLLKVRMSSVISSVLFVGLMVLSAVMIRYNLHIPY